MTQADFTIKTESDRPTFSDTLTDKDGDPVDLSNATNVWFYQWGPRGTLLINDDTQASITDAANGKVEYDYLSDQVIRQGANPAEWKVEFSDGDVQWFPQDRNLEIVVAAPGGDRDVAAADLDPEDATVSTLYADSVGTASDPVGSGYFDTLDIGGTPYDEEVEDIVGALVGGAGNIAVTYDDANDTLTVDTSALNEEEVEDAVGALVTAGNATSVTYDDANDTLTVGVDEAGLSFYDGTNLTADVVNGSVSTDDLYSESKPISIVIYKDSGGTIHAVGGDGTVDSGSDFATVVQSAVSDLTTGGDIFIRSGDYTVDSTITLNNPGVRLVGEGAPWVKDGTTTYGTGIRAGSVTGVMIDLDAQFTGIHRLGLDGAESVVCVETSNVRDYQITRCGIRGGDLYNVHIQSKNTWLQNNWIEYAEFANVYVEGNDSHMKTVISGNMFVGDGDGQSHIVSTANEVRLTDNTFNRGAIGLYDFGGGFENWLIQGNIFRGIGRDPSPESFSDQVIHVQNKMEGCTISGNRVVAEDNTGAVQTVNFIEFESGITFADVEVRDNNVTGLSGVEIIDNGNASYKGSHAKGYLSGSSQSISSSTWTTVAFDATQFDYRGEFDTTNNQFVADEAGEYAMKYQVDFGSLSAGDHLLARVLINGSAQRAYVQKGVSDTNDKTLMGHDNLELSAGDTVEVEVHNASGSCTVSTGNKLTYLTVNRVDDR